MLPCGAAHGMSVINGRRQLLDTGHPDAIDGSSSDAVYCDPFRHNTFMQSIADTSAPFRHKKSWRVYQTKVRSAHTGPW